MPWKPCVENLYTIQLGIQYKIQGKIDDGS